MTSKNDSVSTDIAKVENAPTVFTDGILAKMKSWDDAVSVFESAGVAVEKFSDYGTGFKLLNDKTKLVGVPFIIVEWRFNESSKFRDDDGNPAVFASAAVVTKHGDKFIVNDGSSGIARQLRMVTDQRTERDHPTPQAGLLLENGLSRSDYDRDNGERATTFYLAE